MTISFFDKKKKEGPSGPSKNAPALDFNLVFRDRLGGLLVVLTFVEHDVVKFR